MTGMPPRLAGVLPHTDSRLFRSMTFSSVAAPVSLVVRFRLYYSYQGHHIERMSSLLGAGWVKRAYSADGERILSRVGAPSSCRPVLTVDPAVAQIQREEGLGQLQKPGSLAQGQWAETPWGAC